MALTHSNVLMIGAAVTRPKQNGVRWARPIRRHSLNTRGEGLFGALSILVARFNRDLEAPGR